VSPLPVELAPLLRTVAALGGVLLLLLAAAWLLRRYGAGPLRRPDGSRLAVTAAQMVDARTRLVLVRRDAVEHLLAIGPAGVTVIETLPITAGPAMAREAAA
jgi:flagellar protein FliO/FliZ